MSETFLFSVFPYVAVACAVLIPLIRYFTKGKFFLSSPSPFLEGGELPWVSVPWSWGILTVLAAHLLIFLVPNQITILGQTSVRMLIMEVALLSFAIAAGVGLFFLSRRRVAGCMSGADTLVLLLLAMQILTGIGVAAAHRWGIFWFASTLTPYLRSLFILKPDLSYVTNMPVMVKVHIVSAFCVVLAIPFTRLIHFVALPYFSKNTRMNAGTDNAIKRSL